MVMEAEQQPLTVSAWAGKCLKSFEKCLQISASEDAREYSFVEDELARFSIWTANIGVFAGGRGSMDHRLREAPDILDMVTGLLEVLDDQIQSCLTVLESFRKKPKNGSKDSDIPAKDKGGFEAAVKAIRSEISRLHKISNTIRRASKESRKADAEKFEIKGEDGMNVEDLLYQRFALNIRDRFPGISKNILKRLVSTMITRRKRVLYRRSRYGKAPIRPKQIASKPAINVPAPVKAKDTPKPTLSQPGGSQSGKKTGLSVVQSQAVSATTLAADKYRIMASEPSVVASGIKTIALGSHDELAFPPAPRVPDIARKYERLENTRKQQHEEYLQSLPNYALWAAHNGQPPLDDDAFAELKKKIHEAKEELEKNLNNDWNACYGSIVEVVCPYCFYTLSSAEVIDEKKWRNHVKNDLDPYVCLFENCDKEHELFTRSEEWLQHMRQHALRWRCVTKSHNFVFTSKEKYENHMNKHSPDLTHAQLHALSERNARTIGPLFKGCPLCGESEVSGRMEEHIAGHLRALALKSLPPYYDDGNEDDPGFEHTSSGANRPATRSTLKGDPEKEVRPAFNDDDGPFTVLPSEYPANPFAPWGGYLRYVANYPQGLNKATYTQNGLARPSRTMNMPRIVPVEKNFNSALEWQDQCIGPIDHIHDEISAGRDTSIEAEWDLITNSIMALGTAFVSLEDDPIIRGMIIRKHRDSMEREKEARSAKLEMIRRMETIKPGQRIVPPCDRCRFRLLRCVKQGSGCTNCHEVRLDLECTWERVHAEEPVADTPSFHDPSISMNHFDNKEDIRAEILTEEEPQKDLIADTEEPFLPDLESFAHFLAAERAHVAAGDWETFPDGSRLFVSNLPTEKVSKRDIFQRFHRYGKLAHIYLRQGYCLVQFYAVVSCDKALETEQDQIMCGRAMHLEISKFPKTVYRGFEPPLRSPSRDIRRESRSPDRDEREEKEETAQPLSNQSGAIDKPVKGEKPTQPELKNFDTTVFAADLDQVRLAAEQKEPEYEPRADTIRGMPALLRALSASRQGFDESEFQRTNPEHIQLIGEDDQVEWDGLRRPRTPLRHRKTLHPPLGMERFPDGKTEPNPTDDTNDEMHPSFFSRFRRKEGELSTSGVEAAQTTDPQARKQFSFQNIFRRKETPPSTPGNEVSQETATSLPEMLPPEMEELQQSVDNYESDLKREEEILRQKDAHTRVQPANTPILQRVRNLFRPSPDQKASAKSEEFVFHRKDDIVHPHIVDNGLSALRPHNEDSGRPSSPVVDTMTEQVEFPVDAVQGTEDELERKLRKEESEESTALEMTKYYDSEDSEIDRAAQYDNYYDTIANVRKWREPFSESSLRSLKGEIEDVQQQFPQFIFKVNRDRRIVTVTFYSSAVYDGQPVELRVRFTFSSAYPASGDSPFTVKDLKLVGFAEEIDGSSFIQGANRIAWSYRLRNRGCLEAVMGYLSGERTLKESILPSNGENDAAAVPDARDDPQSTQVPPPASRLRPFEIQGPNTVTNQIPQSWSDQTGVVSSVHPDREPTSHKTDSSDSDSLESDSEPKTTPRLQKQTIGGPVTSQQLGAAIMQSAAEARAMFGVESDESDEDDEAKEPTLAGPVAPVPARADSVPVDAGLISSYSRKKG